MINLKSLDNKALSDQVKTILQREFGELPDFGIAAGQAIASAIYEAIELPVSTRFKDLDIFVNMMEGFESHAYDRKKNKMSAEEFDELYTLFEHDAYKGRKLIEKVGGTDKINKRSRSPMAKNPRGNTLKVSQYGELSIFAQINKNHYSITNVENPEDHPELNYIGISYSGDPEAYQRTVVEGFDINMVQASFNLETGELDWTPEFQDFLFSREIKANAIPTTPVHTAVRLLEKEQLFEGVTLNYEHEIKRLQDMKMLMDLYASHNNTRLPNSLFGDGFKERIEPFKERYSQYWDIKNHQFFGSGGFVDLFNAVPKSYTPELHSLYKYVVLPLVEGSSKATRTFNFESVFDIFEHAQSLINPLTQKDKKRTEAYLPYLEKHISLLEQIKSLESKRQGYMQGKDMESFNIVKNEIQALHEAVKPYQTLAIAHLYNEDFTLAGLQDSTVKRWMSLGQQHPELANHILVLSKDDQLKAVKNARWLDKRGYGHIIGTYESGKKPIIELSQNSPAQIVDDYRVYAEEIRERASKAPLLGDLTLNNIQCKEITTMFDLEELGRRERHCVGGYWDMLKAEEAIVFLMESKDEQGDLFRSTIMFNTRAREGDGDKEPTAMVKFNQHYARQNTPPNEAHEAIVEILKEKIEDCYREKGYEINSKTVGHDRSMRIDLRFN